MIFVKYVHPLYDQVFSLSDMIIIKKKANNCIPFDETPVVH